VNPTGPRQDDAAEVRSIARLLRPRSIAVVGAGHGERSIGRAVVVNLVAGGFAGSVHPVNLHRGEVAGIPAVGNVLEIDGPVDLAVVAVPAAAVLDVARDCAAKGVFGLVVISGGFAELAGGAQLQRELVALGRDSGMRLVGPNCVGVMNTDPSVRMNATFSPVAPVAGRVGVASQSGGVGIELLARARGHGLGISTFVSLGNKADVSGNDLLRYWADDPSTDVAVLYLESFGNPKSFARIARTVTPRKPVIALKSGRSEPGARGTRSHTAALADPDTAVDALLHQTGVIRVDTLAELLDVASLLAHQPVPQGTRVAVMSNGGGPAIVAADACIAAGLEVPELSQPLQRTLAELVPTGGVRNPVDLIAGAGPEVFERALACIVDSGEVDAVLVIYVAPYVTHADEIEAAITRAVAETTTSITIACSLLGLDQLPAPLVDRSGSRAIPTFAFPEAAARAIAHAARLGVWRNRPPGTVTHHAVDVNAARARVHDALADESEDGWTAPETVFGLLADYGIPTAPSRLVSNVAEARAAAAELRFPLVMKAVAPGLVHKSDVGGVRLDLRDDADVVDAYRAMQTSVGDRMTGVVVQPMVQPGLELIVGIHHDLAFGPLVMFGMGGFAAELERDRVVRVPPLTDTEIDEMLRALRASPLLFGYRNSAPADVEALRDLLGRVSQLAGDVDEIAELDCNPVVATPSGVVVVDAKLRLVRRPRSTPFELT
jgi:acyl-CoA synthetase (NDP forming)